MEQGITYHCHLTLEGALKHWKMLSVTENGEERPATKAEVIAAIETAKKKGYTNLPPCDNVDETGRCKGHKEKVE